MAIAAAVLLTASQSLAQTTLYWYPGAAPNQGGGGTWNNNEAFWSTTSGATKTTPATPPVDGDSVVFGGVGGTVSLDASRFNTSTYELNDWSVEAANYTFSLPGNPRTVIVNTFSGSDLASSTFDRIGSRALILDIRADTAYTGTITGPSGGGTSKAGDGRLDLSSATITDQAQFTINGGTVWLSAAQVATTGGIENIIRFGAAADLGGSMVVVGDGGPSTLNRALGGTGIALGASDSANITAGLGARNGALTVNIGGASAELSWGAASFRATTLILGTTDSTHSVTMTNPLRLTSDNRVLHVENGAAAIDAELTGALSTSTAGRILTRDGSGTLRLSGNTSSTLRLNQTAGTTLIDGSWSSTADNTNYGIQVAAGAVLGGDGAVTLSNANLNVSGTLMGGRGTADQSLTINSNLNLLSDSILAFGLGAVDSDQLIRAGGTWSFQSDQQVRLFDAGAAETTYTLITGLSGVVNVDDWQIVNSGPLFGTFSSDASNVYLTLSVIPEPGTAVLLGLGLLAMGIRRRMLR